ncbi:MAG: tryptophan-rich sensory protein [Cyanobacteria bacterium P01_A01_bin.84]
MQQSSSQTSQNSAKPLLTLIAIITAFAINVVSNIYPLNGQSIGEISNTLFKDVLIIPANYAFIIWGVIYLGLFAFGIYQILPLQKNQTYLNNPRSCIIIASIAQCVWVYLFLSRLFVFSVLAMVLILLPLIITYLHLKSNKVPASGIVTRCVRLPLSIYLGWISVATVVNVASALYYQNWDGWGISEVNWTLIMLGISTLIATILTLQYREIPYTCVTVWALVAIVIKQTNNQPLNIIAIVAMISAIMLSGIILLRNFSFGQSN